MAIVNVTPDSFSDGGDVSNIENFKFKIQNFIGKGADIIDVGGESTGPGSGDVSAEGELARLRPVIDWIAEEKLSETTLFSIDTYKASVAQYALEHGFGMVNDVTALRGDPDLLSVLLEFQPYVVLMYSKDFTARTTSDTVKYDDVIQSIKGFLSIRIDKLLHAGFPKDRILIDPGMGMFVSADPAYSYEIVDRLDELKTLGCPILLGPSRKSFLGGEVGERDEKSWKVARKAIANGASVVRMHTLEPF